jgi:hypothetical protein
MNFTFPTNTLPRLEALIGNATDTDGGEPLTISFEIHRQGGGEPSAEEVEEIRALLLGYAADGPYDGEIDAGSIL